jgi:transposase-like protein
MEDYPQTLAELEVRFRDEVQCRGYLAALRWPEGFVCPACGHEGGWRVTALRYECAACHHQASVTAGTVFDRTRKPLVTWFRAIWLVTSQKNGASAKGVQRVLGLGSYETAWTWLHKLRRAMVRPGRDQLAGTVDVDETYVGGEHPGKHGRGAEGKTLVLIAAQHDGAGIGRIRLRRIDDLSGPAVGAAVQTMVAAGSVVRTDGLRSYGGLTALGFTHEVVRHDEALGKNLLPRCHRVASLLKRWLLGTQKGYVSPEHLDYYLDEYTFRFNRRTSQHRGKLFYRCLQQAMMVEPAPYKTLIRHARGPKPQRVGAT